ncbi:MAG: uridine diphosphate-N-acetylglucosamine-binding protein YvcK [Candidatus Omnitrophica bacterium]|nr:uridine diphosphate-N-acetylglucosamine-binding protein YvcK [Candidatus Omnitrophota bacterium]
MGKAILVVGNRSFVSNVRTMASSMGIRIVDGKNAEIVKSVCKHKDISSVIFDDDTYRSKDRDLCLRTIKAIYESKKDFIIVSSRTSPSAVLEAKRLGASDYIARPYSYREFLAHLNTIVQKKTRISCIGGGTGLFHLLSGLKDLPNIFLTSIVSMTDEGGSSGRLRTSFGILPPGDIRRSLVALSNVPEIMNEVMQYRFCRGDGVAGHSFGNLFLAALTEIKGSFSEGVKTLSDILNIQGIVTPVTNMQATLCARFEGGAVVKGESKIDLCEGRDPGLHIRKIWHEPQAECNIDAFSAIVNSDLVTIGPGDLFTSLATNLLVKNLHKAICRTKAKKVYICNLMTKPGETAGYSTSDHVREIIKYMGGDYLDYIIISNTKCSGRAIRHYAKKYQHPVSFEKIDKIQSMTKAKVIMADVSHETELVRHDSVKIRDEVQKILDK